MPRPSEEAMQELRTLYIQRETLSHQLTGILDKIHILLHQQEDYQRWYDGDGLLEALPNWIHEVTGGRPFYSTPQRPVVQRRRNEEKKAREPVLSEEFQDSISGKLDKLMGKRA